MSSSVFKSLYPKLSEQVRRHRKNRPKQNKTKHKTKSKKKKTKRNKTTQNQNQTQTADEATASKSKFYLARVQTKLERATIFVTFKPESKEFPPYRIENFTMSSITVSQKVLS